MTGWKVYFAAGTLQPQKIRFYLSCIFQQAQKNASYAQYLCSEDAAGVVCVVFFNSIMIYVSYPFLHTVFLYFSFFPQKYKNLHKLHQTLKTPVL